MFSNQRLVNQLVRKIGQVEKKPLEAIRDRRIEQEPAITDRLMGSMEHVLNNKRVAGVRWTVKTLTDRGRGSQESEFGADFMAVFQLSIDGYKISKGFLAQSKLIEPSQSFSTSESNRLKDQCQKMLQFSQASYTFLYSQQSGILVVPAAEVIAARNCNLHELTSKKMGSFYREHFECFIGDWGINSANHDGLESLRRRYEISKLILVYGSYRDEIYDNFQLSLLDQN